MVEFSIDIRSLGEFERALAQHHALLAPNSVDAIGAHILSHGCREPLTGQQIAPEQLEPGAGWREGLAYAGISSRVRAVMLCMEQQIVAQSLTSPRIYAAEALTAFAMRLRGLYPRFLGSEYTQSDDQRAWLYPIPCEDLQALSMADGMFDLVSSNEVLEHVPSIDEALKELARVLRPGGWHFGTVPFRFFDEKSQRRAMLSDTGELVHLMEPEYHGDPMNSGGVLVFELPAWDLIPRALDAGFSDAFMRLMISSENGVLAEHIGGVLVFCCQK